MKNMMQQTGIWGITGNWAEIYQACFVPTIIAPWVSMTLELVAPRAGERMLDVACGTGAVTRHAAKLVGPSGYVAGIDLSPDALAVARAMRRLPASASIEWHETPADKLPFDRGDFDIVTCQLGLMFFSDRVAALKEMHRVLAKGGRIAVMTWGALDKCAGNAAVARAWREYIGNNQADQFNPPHSLCDPDEVKSLLCSAGFTHIEAGIHPGHARFVSSRALVRSYGALVALNVDAATRDAIFKTVARLMKPYMGPRGLRYPVEAVMARAQR